MGQVRLGQFRLGQARLGWDRRLGLDTLPKVHRFTQQAFTCYHVYLIIFMFIRLQCLSSCLLMEEKVIRSKLQCIFIYCTLTLKQLICTYMKTSLIVVIRFTTFEVQWIYCCYFIIFSLTKLTKTMQEWHNIKIRKHRA